MFFKVAQFFSKILVSLIVSGIFAFVLAPIAYAERGYHAYGGETILVLAIFLLVLYVLNLKPKKSGHTYE